MSKYLGGSLSIRTSNDGNIVTFASKDSNLAQYIDITSKGAKLNYKVGGEWKNTITLATKDDLGITQYKGTQFISMSGKLSSIGEWLKTADTSSRWNTIRVDPTDSDGYFGTSGFSILWQCSSANYGWCILMSDNAKVIVFGRNVSGWHWYAPTLSEVS